MRFGGLDDGRNGIGGKTAHGDPIRLAVNPSPGWPPRIRTEYMWMSRVELSSR